MAKFEIVIDGTQLAIYGGPDGPATLEATDLTPEIQTLAAVRGLKEKLMDGAALGKGATDAEKFDAVSAIMGALREGVWSRKREKIAPDAITPDRVTAIANIRKKPVEIVRAWLEALTSEQRINLYDVTTIVVELARLKAERSGKVDACDAFEGL